MFRFFLVLCHRSIFSGCVVLSLLLLLTPTAFADDPNLVTTDTPNRLVVPALALDSPVIPVGRKSVVIDGQTYTQWETADNVVGWHNLSARPGQVGNMVLAGHSDAYARVFQNLININIGDEVVVFAGDKVYYYFITQKFLVQEKGASIEQRLANARWIAETDDERLTMVTCAGPGATHRLIVIGRPVAVLTP